MLKRNSVKYNFNREITDYRISKETILLPLSHNNDEPDWSYIEAYIKNLIANNINKLRTELF